MSDQFTPAASRIVIIGAGAIGSHLAACLRKGVPALIVDPCRLVRAEFVTIGRDTRCPTDDSLSFAEGDPRLFRADDIVLLATSASVAAAAVATVPVGVPVVCLANGVIPALDATRNGSLSHGVVEFAVHCTSPGVATRARDGWLTLQRTSPGHATTRLAAAFDPTRQRVRLTDNIDAHRHAKLMLNASLDPVAAAIGGTIGDVFRGERSFPAFLNLLGESLRVARAAGWKLAPIQGVRPDVLHAIFRTPGIGAIAARSAARQAATVSSTLGREVLRGELGEADHLCGAIIRQGARLGVPTPAHSRAMEVLRKVVSEGPLPQGTGTTDRRDERAGELLRC